LHHEDLQHQNGSRRACRHPAFAKSHRAVYQDYAAGYATAAPGSDIPAYDAEGSVVGIANPDQYGAQSQR
jgi:hypothetical protein